MITNVIKNMSPRRPLPYATRLRPSGMSRRDTDNEAEDDTRDMAGEDVVEVTGSAGMRKSEPSTSDMYALYSRYGPTRMPGK